MSSVTRCEKGMCDEQEGEKGVAVCCAFGRRTERAVVKIFVTVEVVTVQKKTALSTRVQ